jgi:ribose transport system ATP-binding protein
MPDGLAERLDPQLEPPRASSLSKTFPGQVALADVALELRRGEVHALLGQNGCGKSTLIKVLAGYHRPDPGAVVSVGSTQLAFGNPRASIELGLRFVHQDLGLVGELDAVENVALTGYERRGPMIDWKAQRAKTEALVGRLGLDLDVRRPLQDATAVERTAVAIARALDDEAGPIRFLVLDEPTAALPPSEVEQLFSVIRGLTAQGIGVLYVSHRLDEVEAIADRATVLREGRVQALVAVDEQLPRAELVELIVGGRQHRSGRAVPAAVVGPEALIVEGLEAATLHGVDLTLRAGEVVGVCGLVGSGRDELPRALTGTVPALATRFETTRGHTAGALRQAITARLGVVAAPGVRQRGAATADFVVRENLTLASLGRYRALGRIRRRAERATVEGWIDRLEVQPPDPERPFQQLSGGNQQKVIVAKWLNTEPLAVVLDEPTAGVDVGARQAIYELVHRQAADGTGFLITSSDLDDYVELCSRVLVLHEGRVAADLQGDDLAKDELLHWMVGRLEHA